MSEGPPAQPGRDRLEPEPTDHPLELVDVGPPVALVALHQVADDRDRAGTQGPAQGDPPGQRGQDLGVAVEPVTLERAAGDLVDRLTQLALDLGDQLVVLRADDLHVRHRVDQDQIGFGELSDPAQALDHLVALVLDDLARVQEGRDDPMPTARVEQGRAQVMATVDPLALAVEAVGPVDDREAAWDRVDRQVEAEVKGQAEGQRVALVVQDLERLRGLVCAVEGHRGPPCSRSASRCSRSASSGKAAPR